jgi:hypothetical protein
LVQEETPYHLTDHSNTGGNGLRFPKGAGLRRFNMSQHKEDVPENPKDMSGPQVISHDDEKG